MNQLLKTFLISAGLLTSLATFAQAPAAAPAGSTGMCKDGSYTSKATKKGSCAKHGGVKDWYAAADAAAPAAMPAAATKTAATAPMAAAPAAMPAPAAKMATAAPATAPAAGGGPGQVWVNSSTKVYHCSGDKYYGKTKHGEYMTEAAAKAAGNHADHGKACAA